MSDDKVLTISSGDGPKLPDTDFIKIERPYPEDDLLGAEQGVIEAAGKLADKMMGGFAKTADVLSAAWDIKDAVDILRAIRDREQK